MFVHALYLCLSNDLKMNIGNYEQHNIAGPSGRTVESVDLQPLGC
jgi:hypothetical protein